MPLGTMDFYSLETAPESVPVSLRFSTPGRTQLPSRMQAQVSVFRLPD
jgi:hypothetical protein